LIAFGIGSVANVLASDSFSIDNLIPSSLALEQQEKIIVIDDPSLEPSIHSKSNTSTS